MVADESDRARLIAAHAAEVRGFQTFFGAVLLAVAVFHLLVVLPFVQVRAALPVVTRQVRATEQELTTADHARQTATAASTAVGQLRRALAATPEQLRRAIAELFARGRTLAGTRGDPYKMIIRVSTDGQAGAATPDEEMTVEQAIRRQIGKHMEALSLSFERALEPLRTSQNTQEIQQALRTAQESVGREIQVNLNKILQEAFSADADFWMRWERQPTFAAVSSQAEEATRRIEETLRVLLDRLASASRQAVVRRQALQTRLEALRAQERDLASRLGGIAGSAPGQWPRAYPIVAGALTLTALFRLRRLLVQRRGLAGVDLDQHAPSWIIGSSAAPGRLWSLALLAAPLAAAVHGSVIVLMDPSLLFDALGEPSAAMLAGYGGAYAVLVLAGLWQFALVARAMLWPSQKAGR
jgi:hypothetical protein